MDDRISNLGGAATIFNGSKIESIEIPFKECDLPVCNATFIQKAFDILFKYRLYQKGYYDIFSIHEKKFIINKWNEDILNKLETVVAAKEDLNYAHLYALTVSRNKWLGIEEDEPYFEVNISDFAKDYASLIDSLMWLEKLDLDVTSAYPRFTDKSLGVDIYTDLLINGDTLAEVHFTRARKITSIVVRHFMVCALTARHIESDIKPKRFLYINPLRKQCEYVEFVIPKKVGKNFDNLVNNKLDNHWYTYDEIAPKFAGDYSGFSNKDLALIQEIELATFFGERHTAIEKYPYKVEPSNYTLGTPIINPNKDEVDFFLVKFDVRSALCRGKIQPNVVTFRSRKFVRTGDYFKDIRFTDVYLTSLDYQLFLQNYVIDAVEVATIGYNIIKN